MSTDVIAVGDHVEIEGFPGEWVVVGSRDGEPHWDVQLGRDAATKHWEHTANLTLIRKAEKPVSEPGFYPGRGIMG